MRRPLLVAASCAAVAGLLIAARPAPQREILFRVTSAPEGEAIEFEAHALGPDLERSADVERAVTPYTLRVPGDEAYVLFRQHGDGPGLLRVTVSPASDRSAQVVSPVSMLVVRGGRAGATIVRPPDGRR